MRAFTLYVLTLFSAAAMPAAAQETSAVADDAAASVERGHYLVVIAGCNDCHTANWNETGGAVAESDWLTGVPIGFRGPWGTTYPSNLRLLARDLDEASWVMLLKSRKALPPMPWVAVNHMSEQDLQSIYRFIASLGPAGARMPLAVAPGVEPQTPYIPFEPLHMERLATASSQ